MFRSQIIVALTQNDEGALILATLVILLDGVAGRRVRDT